ncbi:MAG: alpha/beta fold hydrolase [Flavobacteriales bacterium]|nr:alpha/beta fold hydrolase [Flavobacteriales bacterium]
MPSHFTHGPTLAYRTYGHGPLPVLAFHGFGRTGEDFHVLEKALGARCTLYAFDLHFHGHSPAYPQRAEAPFTPQELAAFFSAFADDLKAPRVTLLGYSLGGRIALSLMEQVPARVERAFLVAPDGLKARPWYRGLAASAPGRWAYRRFVDHPGRVHALMDLLHAARLLNDRMHRFLKGQTDSRAKRQLVHDVWLSYRLIEPHLARVAANARQHQIPLHLVFGRFDRVIPTQLAKALQRHAPELVTVDELEAGHVLLTPALGPMLGARMG